MHTQSTNVCIACMHRRIEIQVQYRQIKMEKQTIKFEPHGLRGTLFRQSFSDSCLYPGDVVPCVGVSPLQRERESARARDRASEGEVLPSERESGARVRGGGDTKGVCVHVRGGRELLVCVGFASHSATQRR